MCLMQVDQVTVKCVSVLSAVFGAGWQCVWCVQSRLVKQLIRLPDGVCVHIFCVPKIHHPHVQYSLGHIFFSKIFYKIMLFWK
jgi:hypothetical protein